MQSHRLPSRERYLSRIRSNSSFRASQSTSFRFSKLRQALQTPSASSKRSGFVSGITQSLQYLISVTPSGACDSSPYLLQQEPGHVILGKPGIAVVDEPGFPQDDVTWFLLEKIR